MNTEYTRLGTSDAPVESIEPRLLWMVVNPKSHYFGCIVEQIDSSYINEKDGKANQLWIKDSITGLWFRHDELEETEIGGDEIVEDFDDADEESEKFLK